MPSPATVEIQWAGDAMQSTVEVSALTHAATLIGPAISPNPDMFEAVIVSPVPPGADGWNRWHVEGLVPGTAYYWQLLDLPDEGDPQPVGSVAAFATLKAARVPCTVRRAVGSCTCNGHQGEAANPAAFEDVLRWAPDRIMHLGDMGYPTHLTRLTDSHVQSMTHQLQAPGMGELLSRFCLDYIHSDHDTNSGNNLPNYNDPVTEANIRAWQHMVPFRQTDVNTPPHGLWRSEVEGRIRFVKLDYRSIERTDSIGKDPLDPRSSMLGATQLAWLQDELKTAAVAGELAVLMTDSSWNGRCPDPVTPTYSDKMPAYQFERDLISDFAAQLGLDMIIVHGDTHLLLHDEGHEKNGFVVVGGSPFDQRAQGHFQDSYDWVYPPGQPELGGTLAVQQYQRLTWVDDGTAITFTAEARSCTGGEPRTVHTLTRTYTP
ncbi:MAG: alkaline phosphatase [Nocardioidaceae bacterium]|nr:alkaline phosphatase [Nocardioidaceae bacterium]